MKSTKGGIIDYKKCNGEFPLFFIWGQDFYFSKAPLKKTGLIQRA